MMTDIKIAQQCAMKPITEIAATAHVDEKYLEQYGRYKAKIDLSLLRESKRPDGKLILVTAITPTPAGEGKTTTTIGLADGLRRIGKDVTVALREPSLGPVFGIKGGAAGGGWAQGVPMEDINLHFTGDFHAIGAANNLLAAMLDNHIQQGNALGIDVKRITWRRCVDMNDRQLRSIVDGLGGRMQGVPREDGFDITVASEVMAVLCLASDIPDLKARLGRIVVGYTYDDAPVTAADLKAAGAMAALLKDALKPNLVQTLEHTPALIHGGPFANIAHGCNSVTATRMALKLGDYAITEAGFGAETLDLGSQFAAYAAVGEFVRGGLAQVFVHVGDALQRTYVDGIGRVVVGVGPRVGIHGAYPGVVLPGAFAGVGRNLLNRPECADELRGAAVADLQVGGVVRDEVEIEFGEPGQVAVLVLPVGGLRGRVGRVEGQGVEVSDARSEQHRCACRRQGEMFYVDFHGSFVFRSLHSDAANRCAGAARSSRRCR